MCNKGGLGHADSHVLQCYEHSWVNPIPRVWERGKMAEWMERREGGGEEDGSGREALATTPCRSNTTSLGVPDKEMHPG